jgi:hypothetical protein
VNAAFLLVTSAWLAGGDTPPAPPTTPPAAPPAAQVAPAPAPGYGCGGGCGSTCGGDSDRPGLLDRLRGRFHREDCGCAPACNTCAPAHHAPACNECERPSFFERLRAKHESSGSCGSTCDECGGGGFLGKLRGRFHRGGDCGCDSGAGCGCGGPGYGGYGAPIGAPPGKPGEPIKPPSDTGPMKLPSGDKPKDKEVSAAPKNLDLTPTGGMRIIDSGTKNPY